MPKSRHPKRKHKNKPKSFLSDTVKELDRIESLIDADNLPEALEGLQELASRFPHRAEIFETMFLVAMQLDDKHNMLDAAIRLTELQPSVAAHHYNLYGVYKQNLFPVLAVQTGRHFLSRWPDLELGKDIRQEIDALTAILQKEAVALHFPEDSWLETMALHEKVQVALNRGHYEETKRLATQLIILAPHFPSPYNNRSLAAWAEGDAEAAIADARRVLEIDPNNVHALSNLTRFLCLTNHPDEAREIAERLKIADSPTVDVWTKKVEALSYLSDDAAVAQIAEQADKAGMLFGKYADPFLMHLAGVAVARLGDEKRARHLWQEAIKRAPSLSRAQANREDLDKPLGERDGPWPFELPDWFSSGRYKEFASIVGKAGESAKANNIKPLQVAARRYVEKHPHIMPLIPVLLERGDPLGREFALRLAQLVETPESLAILKDFVHSANGPDKLRHEALQFLHEKGIVQNGQMIQFWTQGRQTEIMVMNYRIDEVPYETLSPKVAQLFKAGIEALKRNDLDRGEQLLLQALAEKPDSASIQHNLALVDVQRGDIQKARARLQALTERHPKYAFAICQLALIEIANDRFELAQDLLKRAGALEHFHYEEYANYCKAQIFSAIADKPDYEAAKQWLEIWEQLLPDDPRLDAVRPLVKNSIFARLRAEQMLAPLRE